jgi:hypothetical protein
MDQANRDIVSQRFDESMMGGSRIQEEYRYFIIT